MCGLPTQSSLAKSAAALAAGCVIGAGVPAWPAAAAVTITDPGQLSAGAIDLRGTVGVGPIETTTVLYVIDATDSTASPAGGDCTGEGVVDARDDLNRDGVVGDTLDCQIRAVAALKDSLAAQGSVQVGLVAFANQAAAADLSPTDTTAFVPAAFTGGDPLPRVVSAARSVTRDRIGLFDPTDSEVAVQVRPSTKH